MKDKEKSLAVMGDAKSLELRLIEVNEARREIGLPLLSVKIRKCFQCGDRFASIESRTCTPCIKKRDND